MVRPGLWIWGEECHRGKVTFSLHQECTTSDLPTGHVDIGQLGKLVSTGFSTVESLFSLSWCCSLEVNHLVQWILKGKGIEFYPWRGSIYIYYLEFFYNEDL